MSGKITLVPIDRGVQTNRTEFNIDDGAFATLINAYQWRGRVKRKRGTELITRFQLQMSVNGHSLTSGSINLITALGLNTTYPNAQIVPGSINIVDTTQGTTYTDPTLNSVLSAAGGTGTGGSINYSTGVLTITSGASGSLTGTFSFYPLLPVMGLEQFITNVSAFPFTVGFDTIHSYNISITSPYVSTNVSFYKNPTATPPTNYPSYVAKSALTPLVWNGEDYQQFWTVNYQGAMWATNGTEVPFDPSNIGMQFKPIVTVTVTSSTTATLEITGHGLVQGDFLFINEVVTTTGINFQTGYVATIPPDANHVEVKFPYASLATDGTGGIAQYLTNSSDPTKDVIRWYDGDPNSSSGLGWVNFMPPLNQNIFSISDTPQDIYYLVGARLITVFKDRLLFLGPVIQTSSGASPVYLQDTVLFSQNGTPFYTCSYTNVPNAAIDTPTNILTEYHPLLVPLNQTATSPAFFEDQEGFGGYAQAGTDTPIVTVSANEDVLIIGFTNKQARFVYTGNDLLPFAFYIINSELGSQSTFSQITTDRGVITAGNHGFIITAQTGAQRIDLDIPDQIFQFNLVNNGAERLCAQRDFINEWIYFTYLDNSNDDQTFPNQTLLYNYRDGSWSVFNETYTTYGTFRKQTGLTWATLEPTLTWATWNTPWDSGSSTLLQPEVIAGNQQGFVLGRTQNTSEANALVITSISGSVITSPDHCLNNGDYIIINGALGTIGSLVNGNIFSVVVTASSPNTFTLNPNLASGSYTYLGGGLIQRMYVPFIQTKQFNPSWANGRKTRIGMQQYLFTTTDQGQVTLNIYLSQDNSNAWNSQGSNPSPNGLVYSQIVYTCPESTNLGLTPANSNLQMPTASSQQQIWHRMSTSMIGDTVQVGITLSDTQMRDVQLRNQFTEIEFHGAIITVTPSSLLS